MRRIVVNTYVSCSRRRWNGEVPAQQLPERAGVDVHAGSDARHDLGAAPARQRVTAPDVRTGFALYQRTAPRIERNGVVVPTLVDVGGQTYRLDDYTIEPFTEADRSARLAVPASDDPRYVQSGLVQRGFDSKMRVRQYVDNRVEQSSNGSGVMGAPLDDRGAPVPGVRVHRDEARGSLVIAVYERADNEQPK